jgi:hypothetical protein
MKNILRNVLFILIWLYCSIAIFDPSGTITGLKTASFALAVLLGVFYVFLYRPFLSHRLVLTTLAIAIVIPTIGILIYFIRNPGQSFDDGIPLAKGLLAILLVLPVVAIRFNFKRVIVFLTSMLGMVATGIFVCSIFDPILGDNISRYLILHKSALIGFREFGEIDLTMIFFITSPLFVLCIPYLIGEIFIEGGETSKRIASSIVLIIIYFASFLSASRAAFLAILAETFVCLLILFRRQVKVFIALIAAGTFVLTFGLAIMQKNIMFSADEQSNSIKLSHFNSFLEYIYNDPGTLLYGSGLGASFYSNAPEVNREIYQCELTYMDTVRYFGWPLTIIFLLAILSPMIYGSSDIYAVIGFMTYLILCGNNPLLYNSTGMLALTFFWAQHYCFKIKKEQKSIYPYEPTPEAA